MATAVVTLSERLARNSRPEPATGCVVWTGSLRPDGYGQLRWDSAVRSAHRMAWQAVNGPIPAGLGVLHKCDQPSCINPAHLFLGTQADNMADKARKGRAARLVGQLNGRYLHGERCQQQ